MKESLKLSTISLITCCLTLVSCGQNKIVDLPSAPNTIAPSDSAQQVAISKVEEPILKLLLGRWRPLASGTASTDPDLIIASGGRLYILSSKGKAMENRYKIDASVNPYVITFTSCNSLDECTDDAVANFKVDSDTRMTLTIKGKSVVLERVSRDSELPSGVEILKVTDGAVRSAERTAEIHLGIIGKTQQSFYLEKSKFSNNIDELQSGLSSSMERQKHYVYEILEVNSGRGSQILLMANHKKLRNFTGIVYNTNSVTLFVACQSNEPSSDVPKFNFTSNNSNEIQCPSGYSQIK